MQFDCTKRANRILRITVYLNNNLKGVTTTRDPGDSSRWRPDDGSAWGLLAPTVCARTAPHGSESK